ncbi:MAG TPA: alpha/beta hydrolase [Acetobacteraceae bacterium]|nr:alpha/beta hydrolase [Acetobacteraceae bacterium]
MLVAAGHRLEYVMLQPQNAGAGDRPTLVFLHEGLGSVAMWKRFPAEIVAATGCAALVYSRYGYGRSDKLTQSRKVDYMHREALDVLPEVLDRLDIHAPVLIGHSDGASIALIHAGAGKRPVRGVVAMAPHVFVEDITVRSIAAAMTTFRTTDLPQRLARYHDDAESAFQGWNDIWLHPDFLRWNIETFLPGVACPLLLIQGEDDQYGTAAQVEAIARQVSGPVDTLMLPDCAHSPHQSMQKDATVAAIARFVAHLGKTG